MFIANLLLAAIWVSLTGEMTAANVLVGFLLGALALQIASPTPGPRVYTRKFWYAAELAGYFAWQLVLANLKVAWDVLTPTHHMRPGVVAVPLDAQSDLEITILANLITLTPGTLSLDVSDDKSVLYVHVMHLGDMDEFRSEIKQGLEIRLLRLLR